MLLPSSVQISALHPLIRNPLWFLSTEMFSALAPQQQKRPPPSICLVRTHNSALFVHQLQPQEISPPPTANLDRSNDKVYENVTGLVKAVIEMSSKIQPASPEEYVPMVKVRDLAHAHV